MKQKHAIIFIILFFLIAIYLVSYYSQKIFEKDNETFEGVPNTYAECSKTDEIYHLQNKNQSKLTCQYTVFSEALSNIKLGVVDKDKYNICIGLGGLPLTFGGDCSLIFYNPDYVFPKNFRECVDEKKGEFTTSIENRCIINIDPNFAYNKEVAAKLINECLALGGEKIEQSERSPRCYIEFKE